MAVERDITWNIRHFQGALRCDRNFDVVYRVFRICGREACMFFVDGFAKDEIMEKLLEFFYGIQDEDLLRDAHTFSTIVSFSKGNSFTSAPLTGTGKLKIIFLIQLPSGCFSGNNSIRSINARMNSFRSTSEAAS